MQWPKVHTTTRTITAVVVCTCAVATWWWTTHPAKDEVTKVKIVQIKQGDGYMSEDQCRSIDRGMKRDKLREKFGVPAEYDDNYSSSWDYPLREDKDRHCRIYIANWYGPFRKGERVDSVNLELIVP